MCGFQGTRNRRRSAYCAESFQDGGFGYKVTKLKPRKRRTAQTLHRFPVTMAKGIHLFPYRTQKLSLSAPMVLGWRRPGRVGRCRIPQRKASDECLGLQTVDKKGTFGIRKYPFTIISSFSSRQRSPFLSFHVASFFKFMDANKRVS